jgi:SAM-dependent methyltransferase
VAKKQRKQKKSHKQAGKKRKQAKSSGKTEAQRADKYDLYQRSVQETDPDLELLARIFKNHYGRPPRLLREDFCGTAAMACRWVELHRENRSYGIDLDPEPLAWGRKHNVGALKPEQAGRIKLIEGDVRDVGPEKADVTIGYNFSYFIFETRDEIREYFQSAKASLLPEGMFLLDVYGGPEAQRVNEEERDCDDFLYIWDQHTFNPITNHATNYIHFEFDDGSIMKRAFRYDWRLWSLPELRELLLEAGFSKVEVYWEGTDRKSGEGNGIFTLREKAIDDPAWVAYLVALP